MRTTKEALKTTIKGLVESKIQLTCERREYKLASRGSIPEAERLVWFSGCDEERRDMKRHIRHHLLAYGMIRGVPYARIEPNVGPDNDPNCTFIRVVLQKHGMTADEDQIVSWVEGGEPVEEAA